MPEIVAPITGDMVAAFKAMEIYEEGGPTWYINAGKISSAFGLEVLRGVVLGGAGSAVKGLAVRAWDTLA